MSQEGEKIQLKMKGGGISAKNQKSKIQNLDFLLRGEAVLPSSVPVGN